MFKSFFPKPGAFFLSAFVWALIAVIFWQAGGGDWVARITGASGQIPISAARFWSLDFLIFYAYYIVGRDPDIPHEQLGGLIGVKHIVSFSMLRIIKNSLKI